MDTKVDLDNEMVNSKWSKRINWIIKFQILFRYENSQGMIDECPIGEEPEDTGSSFIVIGITDLNQQSVDMKVSIYLFYWALVKGQIAVWISVVTRDWQTIPSDNGALTQYHRMRGHFAHYKIWCNKTKPSN